MDETLIPFFSPRGVALVGATQDPTKLGYGLARNLVQSNYRGVVHFVNPKGGSLLGRAIFPLLSEVPDPVDLAVLLIPAPAVPQALYDCAARGLRAVIIASGGFRETGTEGEALEKHCLQIARQHGIRLIGPNCIGLIDTHLPLDTTFLPPPGPLPGDVAFISHSGAICAAVIDWARGQGFGLSRLISLGNQADVNETDMLAPVAADPYTRVLTLYLEGISNGRRFVEAAYQVSRNKPVIALKVGRFASGQRAVTSHTGAMAGQENAFNAAFHRAGVIRANTSEELFDWARALAWCPPPAGRAMAVLTNAGGPGVTAADALEFEGLQLAAFSAATRQALSSILPPAASLLNPVDMLASASPEQYASCLQFLLADSSVDGVLVILPPPPMHTAGAVAKALIPVIHAASKPVVIALMGERLIQEAVEHFRAARIPEYRFPERAASALAILAQRAEFLRRPAVAAAPFTPVDRSPIENLMTAHPAGWLSAVEAQTICSLYGIPVPPAYLATSAQQAVRYARRVGFPVVLKIASPDVLHKSDGGGVLLDLENSEEVHSGYHKILAHMNATMPAAQLSGVIVQRFMSDGQDVIIGMVRDAQFGPLMMFGSGGIEVEGLKDVSFGLAPLNTEDASDMLQATWAGRKLGGFRHLPSVDRQAVQEILVRLAQLAIDYPQIAEVEINPLRVMEKGAFALDVRLKLTAVTDAPG